MGEAETTTAVPENPPPETGTMATTERKPKFSWSAKIGQPTYIVEPKEIPYALNLSSENSTNKTRLLDDDTVVKHGRNVTLGEADAMRLIAEKTTIPCPKVEAAYVIDDEGYIIMSYERGQHFEDYWDEASETQRESLIAQLKDYVSQMRKIKGSFIGRVDYTPCKDAVFEWDYSQPNQEYGPFDNQEALNEGLVLALENRFPPQTEPPNTESEGYNYWWQLKQMARSFRSQEIVFTHGYLQPGSMRVRDDETVVLENFEFSGFYPDYWEFYKTTYWNHWRPDFARQFERFIPPFYIESFVMRHILDKIIC